MGFISVCRALYDYQPQSAEELEIKEGELLYILEVGQDDWWKARKKAEGDDDEEPEGLIPNNYVEALKPSYTAKALYDYTRQTDEEVSFSEDTSLDVYDSSDPDWTLVGANGEYGFAPANYIEIAGEEAEPEQLPTPQSPTRSIPSTPTVATPAANLARVLGGVPSSPAANRSMRDMTPEASDEEPAPALPRRPPSQTVSSPPIPQTTFSPPPQRMPTSPPTQQSAMYEREIEPPGIVASPPHNRVAFSEDTSARAPGGFHLYNISEMVSVMGRRKKMPTTLGLNIATGTIMLSPEKSRDGPTQEWTADKLSHHSIEGKHVFLELVRPSKSLDLHAGAKDTAQEIVFALGEIAGAHRAEGFKEVLAAASGGGTQKKGVVLYDFMAQGDDEVTVAVGDEIIILDDEKSEEWWNIRRLKNGKEGVMPSSYIEITGIITAEPSRAGVNAGRSTVEQNRLEEERLAKEAAKREEDSRQIQLPARGSSLGEEERRKKEKKAGKSDKARSKPDPNKTRTWTDQSGSFKVDAQFIGIADGKIHLHKANGVKIAVPVTKMSADDLDYVEKVTHESIEEHIPVADLIKIKRKNQTDKAGASIEPSTSKPKTSDYDWFDFFLSAGVGPHQCERYAQAMVKDSMDESVLPDITTDTLRTLGLKEGDALKVMKYLDQRYSRTKASGEAQSGIFSGPGGALRDNTRRGRPDANRTTNDVVDASAFETSNEKAVEREPPTKVTANGFDDDAWEVKPSTPARPAPPQQQKPVATTTPVQAASENLAALSLLDKPLEPTPAIRQPPPQSISPPPPHQSQQTGANPSFFSQIQPPTSPQGNAPPRQRPQAPQQNFNSSLLPPPRPASAPQTQQNQFGVQPLQPQMTGIPNSARPAPPGQSLDEITAQRMQQQFLQSQPTGYGFGYQNAQQAAFSGNGMMPQPTGFLQNAMTQPTGYQYNPSLYNGNANGSPFADPRPFQPQPTGFLQPGPAPGSLNSILPPALVPLKTGYQPQNGLQSQPTGYQASYQQQLQPQPTGFGQNGLQSQPTAYGQNGFGTQLPPVPPIPQQAPAPLVPQKTGPAPNVKFGMSPAAKKLVPQPTGRANLANATPSNPFGF